MFMKQASAFGLLRKVKFVDQDLGLMPFLNNLRKGDPTAPIGILTASDYPFYLFNDPANVEFYTEVFKRSKWYPDMMASRPPMVLEFLKTAMEKAGTTENLEKVIDAAGQGVHDQDPDRRTLKCAAATTRRWCLIGWVPWAGMSRASSRCRS